MKASLVKSQSGGLKNPLTRARGLGPAHGGLHHWIAQRVTAVASIPLMVWLAWSIIGLVHADHAVFIAWLAKPINAVLMILCIVTFFYHSILGNQVVIEDYIHNEGFKIIKLVAMKLLLIAAAVASLYAVLKVAL